MVRSGAKAGGRHDHARDPIGRGLAVPSLPIFAELIARSVDAIVEICRVGRPGSDALGAMSPGFMIPMMVRAVGMGIRVAGRNIGAGETGRAVRSAWFAASWRRRVEGMASRRAS